MHADMLDYMWNSQLPALMTSQCLDTGSTTSSQTLYSRQTVCQTESSSVEFSLVDCIFSSFSQPSANYSQTRNAGRYCRTALQPLHRIYLATSALGYNKYNAVWTVPYLPSCSAIHWIQIQILYPLIPSEKPRSTSSSIIDLNCNYITRLLSQCISYCSFRCNVIQFNQFIIILADWHGEWVPARSMVESFKFIRLVRISFFSSSYTRRLGYFV